MLRIEGNKLVSSEEEMKKFQKWVQETTVATFSHESKNTDEEKARVKEWAVEIFNKATGLNFESIEKKDSFIELSRQVQPFPYELPKEVESHFRALDHGFNSNWFFYLILVASLNPVAEARPDISSIKKFIAEWPKNSDETYRYVRELREKAAADALKPTPENITKQRKEIDALKTQLAATQKRCTELETGKNVLEKKLDSVIIQLEWVCKGNNLKTKEDILAERTQKYSPGKFAVSGK